jgi:DNA-binding transcriptional regulator YdaS (Cro superfamily)
MDDTPKTVDEAMHPVDLAAQRVGGRAELARLMGVGYTAIGNWKTRGVDAGTALRMAQASGIDARLLCPDAPWHVLRNVQPTGQSLMVHGSDPGVEVIVTGSPPAANEPHHLTPTPHTA